MRPKARKARDHLVRALSALEDPQGYCKQQGHDHYTHDLAAAKSFAMGAAQSMIRFALEALGEPIDPFRSHDAGPYVRPTERERIEMCGSDPVRNEELGL